MKNRKFILTLAIGAAIAPMALAQSTPPDMTPVVTAASSAYTSFITTHAPALIGIVLLGAGFRFVLRLMRKGIR